MNKAIEFKNSIIGNLVIDVLDMQEGLSLTENRVRPISPIRTGGGVLITQKIPYLKRNFNFSGTSFSKNISDFLDKLFKDDLEFRFNIFFTDGDLIDKGVRGKLATSFQSFICRLIDFNTLYDVNNNTRNINAEISEI